MRLRKKWWARPEMETSPLVIVDTEKVKGRWQEKFNNDNPIHLELGCGRGKFITDLAENNPDINYIAIDLKDEILIYVLRAVKEKNLNNVRIVPKEIAFIKEVLDKDEIEKIYINFCNPWPKKSHHKRRLTHIRKLKDYKTFLKSDSEVWFKTDDKDLFDASIEYFNQCGFDIKYSTYDLHKSDFKENVITEYENKFMQMGMPIMFLIAVHKNCK